MAGSGAAASVDVTHGFRRRGFSGMLGSQRRRMRAQQLPRWLLPPALPDLYGRRMYDVMVVWENAHAFPDQTPETEDYASIWKSADKIVYSTTLREVNSCSGPGSRASLTPRRSEAQVRVGGRYQHRRTTPRGERAQGWTLVDECHLFVSPAIVGGGNAWLPDDLRVDLKLIDQRRFGNGVVYLRYAVSP